MYQKATIWKFMCVVFLTVMLCSMQIHLQEGGHYPQGVNEDIINKSLWCFESVEGFVEVLL